MSYEQLNDWSLSVRRLLAEIDGPRLLRALIDELAAEVAFSISVTADELTREGHRLV